MSYITFKIITLAVMVVILIVMIVKKKSSNNPEKSQEVTKTNEQPNVEPQDKVDYQAIHDEMYYVEYKLIPHFVEMFKDQPNKSSQIVLTIYKNLITLQNHLREVAPLAFGNVSGEVCGDIDNVTAQIRKQKHN